MAAEEQKLLTFYLDKEKYGIPIMKVKELIGMTEITRVPKMPGFVRGVINLRDKIIPIVDLRMKFGIEPKEYNDRTCIIIVETLMVDKKKILGLVVDSVSDVVSLSSDSIDSPPEYGSSPDQSAISGMAKIDDVVVIILNIDRIFMSDDITVISSCLKEGSI